MTFDSLLKVGAVHEAIELVLGSYEASPRDPGAAVVRLQHLSRAVDLRGAGWSNQSLRARVAAVYRAARLPMPEALESLWARRPDEVGVVAFPVVDDAFESPIGALRWLRAEVGSGADAVPPDPALRRALQSARSNFRRIFPDAALAEQSFQFRVEPELASNAAISGGSVGGAAIVALVSLYLRRPVPSTHVVSAEIRDDGRTLPVDSHTLSAKRRAAAAWPQVRFFVAPGHPDLLDQDLAQVGSVSRVEDLLTLFQLPWWSYLPIDRLRWIDRSWREARALEEWFLHLVETRARFVPARDGRRIEGDRWAVLVEQLQSALVEWRSHFETAFRASTRTSDARPPVVDCAGLMRDAPLIPRSNDLDSLEEVRRRVSETVLAQRAELERWVVNTSSRE